MESQSINNTFLDHVFTLLGNPCIRCPDNSSYEASSNEDPERLLYILLLMGSFAFLTIVVLYQKVSSRHHSNSSDPYHTYIEENWKRERQPLASTREGPVSLSIGNRAVVDTHIGPEPRGQVLHL